MDDVKLIEYHLQIKVGCPKCNSIFEFVNYEIPQEIPTYVVCEKCNVALCVKPFEIIVQPKTSVTVSLIKDAKKIVKSYGFKVKEINHVLKNLDITDMTLETLVKTVLSKMDKNEHATTK